MDNGSWGKMATTGLTKTIADAHHTNAYIAMLKEPAEMEKSFSKNSALDMKGNHDKSHKLHFNRRRQSQVATQTFLNIFLFYFERRNLWLVIYLRVNEAGAGLAALPELPSRNHLNLKNMLKKILKILFMVIMTSRLGTANKFR